MLHRPTGVSYPKHFLICLMDELLNYFICTQTKKVMKRGLPIVESSFIQVQILERISLEEKFGNYLKKTLIETEDKKSYLWVLLSISSFSFFSYYSTYWWYNGFNEVGQICWLVHKTGRAKSWYLHFWFTNFCIFLHSKTHFLLLTLLNCCGGCVTVTFWQYIIRIK